MEITYGKNKLYFDDKVTLFDVAKSLGEISKTAVAGRIDGVLVDLSTEITEDCTVEFVTLAEQDGLNVYRHTCTHVLAQALKTIYPTCSLAIGPTIENGFYYDVDFKTPITQDDFDKIEDEMKSIIKSGLPIVRYQLTKKQAIDKMKDYNEPYKVQIIEDMQDDQRVTFYKQGAFSDLCKGPHLPNTKYIKAFKLTSLTGAYWRGDSKNKMLYRIYGTAFEKKSELDEYLKIVEDARKRDHNRLGRELGFFTTVDEIGKGLPIILPKGAKVIQVLQRFVEDEEERRGYLTTKTPVMAKTDFYKTSGHFEYYKKGTFNLGEKGTRKLSLRSTTSPFQFEVFMNRPKSYRDMPVKLRETSTLFRDEDSGEINGLMRLRQFTISEGYVICTEAQMREEFSKCLDLTFYALKCVGLKNDLTYRFSKRNQAGRYLGSAKEWEKVQTVMKTELDHRRINYTEVEGDASYYGPKFDIMVKNAYKREVTLVSIQMDFELPKRFNMQYTEDSGEKKYPYVIHRTTLGSYERLLAILIEKYAGAMPLWFAPEQVRIINVNKRGKLYGDTVVSKLVKHKIRCGIDFRDERLEKKIRDAEKDKVPYMLIVGGKEDDENFEVSVRRHGEGDKGKMTLNDFIKKAMEEISSKKCYKTFDNKVIK